MKLDPLQERMMNAAAKRTKTFSENDAHPQILIIFIQFSECVDD